LLHASSRIVLADGRELIDGIASWWTACHGYNHPHIRAAVESARHHAHVMFAGLVHEQALTLAAGSQRSCPAISIASSFRIGSVAVEVAMRWRYSSGVIAVIPGEQNSWRSRAPIMATRPVRCRSAILARAPAVASLLPEHTDH
jgi:hypothetical protein